MSNCPWMSVLRTDNEATVTVHKQAYQTLQLPSCRVAQQTPTLAAFIGKKAKSRALRQIFTDEKEVIPLDPHCQVRLWSDPRTRKDDSPLIYVDCELHIPSASHSKPYFYGGFSETRRISWIEQQPQDQLANRLYARVLAPFISVWCIFAADFGGLRGAVEVLAQLAVANPNLDLPEAVLPRVLVVCQSTSPSFDTDAAEAKIFHNTVELVQDLTSNTSSQRARSLLLSCFQDIRIINHDPAASPPARARQLRSRIVLRGEAARAARSFSRRLFSFSHFQALLLSALDHFTSHVAEPFKLVRAARARRQAPCELEEHIYELFSKLPSEAAIFHTAVPLISSALLLDSCPPGAHYFPPSLVFQEFYEAKCSAAIRRHCVQSLVQSKFVDDVKAEFEWLYLQIADQPQRSSAAEMHLNRIRGIRRHVAMLFSHRSCFCCVKQKPEKVLTPGCGHAFCNNCVKIFGVKSSTEQYTVSLQHCLLCYEPCEKQLFEFWPPTTGPRVLSLDGGGVKGVIPLTFLQSVEKQFSHLCLPLRNYFDIVLGTSSGGLIILGMFLMQWELGQCLANFEELALKIFKRRKQGSMMFHRAQELAMSYWADCRYETSGIEGAFQEAFGSSLRLFNPLNNDTKIAVTATTVKDSQPCLFSNYNGSQRPMGTGYSLVRARKPEHDISVSEAARCTSAAPWFFKPKVLKHLGVFQDGGLRHNNPLGVALWESRFLWPERGDPDFALSLGTGTASSTPFESGPASPIKDRFFSRLFRTFMLSMDGEKAWDELKNTLPNSRTHFHRLNLTLSERELSIDDVSIMESLKQQALQHINCGSELRLVCDSIYASAFYFELDGLPEFVDGNYSCIGHVFCRWNLPRQGRKALYKRLLESSAYFVVNGTPTPCVEAVPKCVPPFKRRVRFTVSNLDDVVRISIMNLTVRPRSISWLPKTVAEVIKAQSLDCPFGRLDHARSEKMLPELPPKRKVDCR